MLFFIHKNAIHNNPRFFQQFADDKIYLILDSEIRRGTQIRIKIVKILDAAELFSIGVINCMYIYLKPCEVTIK